MILNLALNARDAMPSGGRLRIETAAEGDAWLRLRVEDDGVGMDEATRARIFEPFFTTKEVGKGTGLGLATTYGIVEQAGGRITVESQPGKGSRFEVRLPRATAGPTVAVTAPANPQTELEPPLRDCTLLVVEDDEAVLEFVCLVLREAGVRILAASDGDVALEVAARHRGSIDLLLTDIVMPNRNGRSLASALRQQFPSLRVMYMSGYPGDTIQRYDEIPPSDGFLQKPFTRDSLLQMVAATLRR